MLGSSSFVQVRPAGAHLHFEKAFGLKDLSAAAGSHKQHSAFNEACTLQAAPVSINSFTIPLQQGNAGSCACSTLWSSRSDIVQLIREGCLMFGS